MALRNVCGYCNSYCEAVLCTRTSAAPLIFLSTSQKICPRFGDMR